MANLLGANAYCRIILASDKYASTGTLPDRVNSGRGICCVNAHAVSAELSLVCK